MKQHFGWAIVGPRDSLSIFSGQCPIFWRRNVAVTELRRRTDLTRRQFRIVKVTILEVYKPR